MNNLFRSVVTSQSFGLMLAIGPWGNGSSSALQEFSIIVNRGNSTYAGGEVGLFSRCRLLARGRNLASLRLSLDRHCLKLWWRAVHALSSVLEEGTQRGLTVTLYLQHMLKIWWEYSPNPVVLPMVRFRSDKNQHMLGIYCSDEFGTLIVNSLCFRLNASYLTDRLLSDIIVDKISPVQQTKLPASNSRMSEVVELTLTTHTPDLYTAETSWLQRCTCFRVFITLIFVNLTSSRGGYRSQNPEVTRCMHQVCCSGNTFKWAQV